MVFAAIVYSHDRMFSFDGKQNPVELSREENVLKILKQIRIFGDFVTILNLYDFLIVFIHTK